MFSQQGGGRALAGRVIAALGRGDGFETSMAVQGILGEDAIRRMTLGLIAQLRTDHRNWV